MDADTSVIGRAVLAAINHARSAGWPRDDAKKAATKLMAALPPFPPGEPGKPPRWEDFGPKWLARSRIPVDEASGWPLCCVRLDDIVMQAFKESVVSAAWQAEVDRRRQAVLQGRPEEALARLGAGWITPVGNLLVCTRLQHMAALRDAGIADELFRQLDAAIEQSGEDKNDFLDAFSEDEHIPWHCYSSDADDEVDRHRGVLVRTAHVAGWIRLGVFVHGRGGRMLSAQGTAAGLGQCMQQLETLADACSMELETKAVDGSAPALRR